jgi:hypothetical protein
MPITEATSIVENTQNNIEQTPIKINTTLNQNYIQFDNEYYRQNDGLAMGAPTSAVITEIFIQHLEHTKIIEILKEHHFIDYYRYIDDIDYNAHTTNIDNTLADFNIMHPRIQFTIEKETDNKLNYLDITIVNKKDQLMFDIYEYIS